MKIVAAGIIYNNNKILIAQRKREKSLGGFWEFPGGKLEEGETLEECLKREIQEELHLDISVQNFFMTSEYKYDFGTINLNAFFAQSPTQKISYMDSHENIRWIELSQLKDFDFAPADRPIVKKLQEGNYSFK